MIKFQGEGEVKGVFAECSEFGMDTKGSATFSDKVLKDSAGAEPAESTPLSKNAMRKARLHKRLLELKERRRSFRAEVKRRKKCAKREGCDKRHEGSEEVQLGKDAGLTLRICIDCQFEEMQSEAEILSLVQQLMYAYGDSNRLNRRRDKASGIHRRWKSGCRKGEAQQNREKVTNSCCAVSTENSFLTSKSKSSTKQAEAEDREPLSPVSETSSPCHVVAQGQGQGREPHEGPFGGPSKGPLVERARPAIDLHIAGVGPKVWEALRRVQCNGRWKCEVSSEPFERLFAHQCATGQAVYLTADADEELHTLDADSVYIVGGIVDRNRYKGLTLTRSKEKGIKAAKLPIGTKLGYRLEGSKILTVNQVVSALIAYAELGDWTQALRRVLPARKGAEVAINEKDAPLEENVLLSA